MINSKTTPVPVKGNESEKADKLKEKDTIITDVDLYSGGVIKHEPLRPEAKMPDGLE